MAAASKQFISEEDYAALEAAIAHSARGRGFLAEYARRARAGDTARLLEAVLRLESASRARHPIETDFHRLRSDLQEMSNAIARTKAEIAAIRDTTDRGGRIEQATEELDAIVQATETATSDILSSAERIQDLCARLRQTSDGDAAAFDGIEAQVSELFTACSFQDLTGQRTRKVVEVLRYLETRIAAMIAILGGEGSDLPAAAPEPGAARPDAHLLNGPAREGEGMSQTAVDDLIADFDAAAARETPAEPAAEKDGGESLRGRIRSLGAREAANLFT